VAIESKTGYDRRRNLMISEEHVSKTRGNLLPPMLKRTAANLSRKVQAISPMFAGRLFFPSCFIVKRACELTSGAIETTYKVNSSRIVSN
jgi:hypothetical protein